MATVTEGGITMPKRKYNDVYFEENDFHGEHFATLTYKKRGEWGMSRDVLVKPDGMSRRTFFRIIYQAVLKHKMLLKGAQVRYAHNDGVLKEEVWHVNK